MDASWPQEAVLRGSRSWSRERLDLSGQTVVVGLARSGEAAVRLLQTADHHVTVVDSRPEAQLLERVNRLDRRRLTLMAGGRHEDVLGKADTIVLSPGVPSQQEPFISLRKRGVRVIGELELASWFLDLPLIAVTGTNGKSTTVTLLGQILEVSGKHAFVGGNLGRPLCEAALSVFQAHTDSGFKGLPYEVVVAEVSSFQLETIRWFHPNVALLLNLTPDHLDRYASFEEYREAKLRIFHNQTEEDVAILNGDDEAIAGLRHSLRPRTLEFSTGGRVEDGAFVEDHVLWLASEGRDREICRVETLPLQGRHNVANALAATLAAWVLGCPLEPIRKALANSRGLAHAMEIVASRRGVVFIDDSKGTNVDATLKALEALSQPVVLIAGGRDKGGDFSRLRQVVRQKVKHVFLLGEAAARIREALGDYHAVEDVTSLQEAVAGARRVSVSGDAVLLSPACSSFDMFQDYQDRGRQFRELVLTLPEG